MVPGLRHDNAVLTTATDFLTSFKEPGRLLVAVSGGSDSTGLLLALSAATAGTAFSLSACTIDHGLRPESALEADRVAALCARLGISHTLRYWEGKKPGTGLQAAARLARYRLLSDAAQETGALCVVTGHTLDDQRETVAMRGARSDNATAQGLSGMADAVLFERRCWVLRPFLGLGRADIRAFVSHQGESWIDDPSNLNDKFERVRVRQSLVPGNDDIGGVQRSVARRKSSERIAGLWRDQVNVHAGLVAHVEPAFFEAAFDLDHLRAILVLASVLGGRVHAPGGETARRIELFLQSGRHDRMTAGRVVFDRRRCGLYLYREARGLASLVAAPGQMADWDGRFAVFNGSDDEVTLSAVFDVRPVAAALVTGGLSEAVAKRGAKAALQVTSKDASVPADAADISIEARIAPYDTFLPVFDFIMANQIACLMARSPFLSPPVHIV